MARSRDDDDDVVAEISGRSITVVWGTTFQQSQWGSARLTVTPTHLIEKTKFFITTRDTTIPLEQISGVTLLTTVNPLFIPLVLVCGLGLILMFLYKLRILIVYAPNAVAVIGVSGTENAARDFMDDLLAEISRAKKKGGGGGSSQAPARAQVEHQPERVTSSPAKAAAPTSVRCP
ncbi:MAG: hypothetical protein ACRC33_22970, partial [Gemmataceae bacterium]